MRVINFNAGPAGLPLPALEQAREELLDFQGTGMSVMEHSHRGRAYEAVQAEASSLIRELTGLPASHSVLFMTGGASAHFALVPLNFLRPGATADYIVTGNWSQKALEEAALLGTVHIAADTKTPEGNYVRVARQSELKLTPDAAYVHSTSNNTLFGTQYHQPLDVGAVPHVCDMSSDFMSRPVELGRYALTYAGAQKNLGPSGVVVVVAEKAFLAKGRTDISKFFRYGLHEENNSLYNTPPTFGVYLVRNVLQWMKREGGLAGMKVRNEAKSALLYAALDSMKGFYTAPVEASSRSQMNVVFRTPSEALDARLVQESETQGLVGLKGHRLTGGLRASLYNAVSVADVEALVSFLAGFAKAHG